MRKPSFTQNAASVEIASLIHQIEEKKKAAEIDAHDDVNDVNDVNEPTISTPSEGEKKKAPSKKRYIIFVGSFKRWMDACDIY